MLIKNLLLLLLCIKLQAQQCKIVYKVVPTFGTLEDTSEVKAENLTFIRAFISGADETLKTMFYNLIINDSVSLFELDESQMKTRNRFAIIAASDEKFHTIKDTAFALKNNEIAKNLALILEPRNSWILERESKIINGYKCFKAKLEIPWRNGTDRNNGKRTYFITAWYCPKIAIKSGPKGFGNLPGLILELQDDRVVFQATTIQFENVPKIPTDFLKKYKKITEQKYFDDLHEMAKSMNYTK